MAERLYVARLKPKGAPLARTNLKRQRFRTLEPKKVIRDVSRGQISETVLDLFPSYMLVWFDQREDPWHLINETFGVMKLIQDHKGPKPLPEAIAVFLETRYGLGPVLELAPPPFTFQTGQRARMTVGPLTGQVGRIKIDRRDRVRWLLSMLGAEQEIKVDPTMLQLVI